jgi:hypothetical protein
MEKQNLFERFELNDNDTNSIENKNENNLVEEEEQRIPNPMQRNNNIESLFAALLNRNNINLENDDESQHLFEMIMNQNFSRSGYHENHYGRKKFNFLILRKE